MDISSIKTTERVIEIVHPSPNGEELGIRVSIMSLSDPRMKKIKRKIQDEKLRLEARNKNFKSEDLEENINNIVFGAMTGWEWYGKDAVFHGKKPEFNRASVLQVFEELPWFMNQIDEALGDEKAFFQQ